jgi:hypothetical protein
MLPGMATNLFIRSAAIAATTWDPANKAASITLSNGNRTITPTGVSYNGVRSIASQTTGKFYVELTAPNAFNGTSFAIGNSSYAFGQPASDATKAKEISNTGSGAGTYGVAIDIANKLYWPTNGSGTFTGNPAAGTGGTAWTFTGAVFLICAPFGSDSRDTTIMNFGNAAFAYAVPSGFTQGFG